MRIFMFLAGLLVLAGCQTTGGPVPAGPGGVEQSWAFARVVIPTSRLRGTNPMEVAIWADPDHWQDAVHARFRVPEDRVPAVIYLHGCAGLPPNAAFVDFLVGQGFAVFAPNSFGRSGRQSRCYAQKGTPIFRFRAEETAYALARLREIPWVDPTNIVLVGHSEGGEAAARWSGDGFRAIVISGADCSHERRAGVPLAPDTVPVLAIIGAKDHREWPGCTIRGRSAPSKAVIIPDAGHSVYKTPEGQREIANFLKACCGG